MLGRGETVGVFQVESGGMRKALVEMRADRFEDLIALVALYRPGPMANIPTYCARKLGHETPDYMHAQVEPVLKETFGVIIYQEQVMQIAQVLSGYSLGEADLLRRAMGKKIKAEMDAQRARFVDGAVARGLARAKADEIFDLLAKFADYGFNKSHAAAYALIAYWTAMVQGQPPRRIPRRLDDARQVQHRQARRIPRRRPAPRHQGRPALGQRLGRRFRRALRRGRQADDPLCARRDQGRRRRPGRGDRRRRAAGAPFASLADFAERSIRAPSTRRRWNASPTPGAFDGLEPDRAIAFAAIEPMLAIATPRAEEKAAGQSALFGEAEAAPLRCACDAWTAADRLQREFDAIGFFLSGHPLEAYENVAQAHAAPSAGRTSRAPCAAARRRRGSPPACSTASSGAPRAARSSASSSSPTPAASTRRSSSRRGWRSTATCWKKAPTCC